MATKAQYDAAFQAAGAEAKKVIEEIVAQTPKGFRTLVQGSVTSHWQQIQEAIRRMSDAAVNAAEKAK